MTQQCFASRPPSNGGNIFLTDKGKKTIQLGTIHTIRVRADDYRDDHCVDDLRVDVLLQRAHQEIKQDQENHRVVDPQPADTHPAHQNTPTLLFQQPSYSQQVIQHQAQHPSQNAVTDAPQPPQTSSEKSVVHLHLQSSYSDDSSPRLC